MELVPFLCFLNQLQRFNLTKTLKMAKFKKEILDRMKADADLYAAVAKEMGVRPTSMPMIIERNGNSLNQYSVVALVASHLGIDANDLVEDEDVKEPQDTAAK